MYRYEMLKHGYWLQTNDEKLFIGSWRLTELDVYDFVFGCLTGTVDGDFEYAVFDEHAPAIVKHRKKTSLFAGKFTEEHVNEKALALASIETFRDQIVHTDAETLLRSLPAGSVDCIVTSPPYGNLRVYGGHTEFDFPELARQMYRALKPGGVVAWIVKDQVIDGSESLTSFKQAITAREIGFRQHDTMIWFKDDVSSYPDPTRYNQTFEFMFIWSKGRPRVVHLQMKKNKNAGDRRGEDAVRNIWELDGTRSERPRRPVNEFGVMSNVWVIRCGNGHTTKEDQFIFEHEAPFPEELAQRHILTWTNPGDIVCDPFGGTGTTAKMALLTGRHWITGDINPDCVAMIEKRIALTRSRIQNADPFQQTIIETPTIKATQHSLFPGESAQPVTAEAAEVGA